MYRWKSSFHEEEGDRADKPRRYGVTEMRVPSYTLFTQNLLQDTFESMGQFVDGLKFTGGSNSMMPKSFIKDVTDMAHKHNVYVSTGDWAEHLLLKGPSGFKEYIEECTRMGFDTVEFNMGSLGFPEETLLRFVRLIKKAGLKAKPQFSVKFEKSDIPRTGNRAYGSYVVPTPQTSAMETIPSYIFTSWSLYWNAEMIEDLDLLIKRAERCLEAGADMIMIDADDVCKYADTVRSDIIANVIGRLGLEKTMFEASNAKTSEWFINQYGPRVNLFVDQVQVLNLECLRGQDLGNRHRSVLAASSFLF